MESTHRRSVARAVVSRVRSWGAVLGAVLLGSVALAAPTPDLAQPGPWLVFDIALGWGMGPTDTTGRGGVRFEVQAATAERFETVFRAEYARLQWYPCAVSLAPYAGKDIRLRLLVTHLDGRIMMDYPHWGNPRIVTGPLVGPQTAPTLSLALTPLGKVAALLPDGSEVPLTEPDPVFNKGLATPGLLNRDLMLLVYAGDNYICIPGKRQPGVYMGVSMSVDFLRIGADPERTPWTGRMPPTVFAEWPVRVPDAGPASAVAAPAAAAAPVAVADRDFQILQTRCDTWTYSPGLTARFAAETYTFDVGMGPSARVGWAFAGVELVGLRELPLQVVPTGSYAGPDDANRFAGLVLDYHSPRGYQDRVFVGLGAGSAGRSDLRPADWNLDGPPLTLARTAGIQRRFVDLSGELGQPGGRLRLALARYAPPDWDGRLWLAAGVQNLLPAAGLTVRLTDLPAAAARADAEGEAGLAPIVLADAEAALCISPRSGAIVDGRDLASGRRVLVGCNDRYTVDTENDVTRTTELLDRVTALESITVEGRPALRLTCTNVALPAVTIEKRYVLEPGRILSKRVGFATTDPRGFFIHWDAETALDPEFLAVSSRGGDLATKQVVAQGKVVERTEKVAAEQMSAGDAPLVTTLDFALGVGAYRFKVNDRYVLRGASRALPGGWLSTVFVDYLKAGAPVSGQLRWVVFAGDFTALDRHYQSLPEVRQLWAFRKPEWPQRVLADAMYLGPPESYPLYRASAPELVTTTIWFLNPPWGNWGPDNDPPKGLHPDVKGIAKGWRTEFPNARVSSYTNALFDDRSDLYREHPEFGVRDLEGQLITSGIASDAGGRPSFYFQINHPPCRQYLLDMHAAKFREWDFDFFYMDGPGFGAEVPDWTLRDVAQSYDWLDYFTALRQRLQEVKPEAGIFVNGANLPYTDIGYIEWRDEQWQALGGPQWRSLALEMLRTKLNEEPGFVVVPTYGGPGADPAMAAYDLLYGWCGHGTTVERLPWMREAFRYRGSRLVEDAVEPRWWRSNVDFEALGFRLGGTAVVNVLDHAAAARQVTVRVDTAKLGLRLGAPVSAELRLMTDPGSALKPDPADPAKQVRVWANQQATTTSPLVVAQPCPAILELTVPTRPLLLTTIVLSSGAEGK